MRGRKKRKEKKILKIVHLGRSEAKEQFFTKMSTNCWQTFWRTLTFLPHPRLTLFSRGHGQNNVLFKSRNGHVKQSLSSPCYSGKN